MDGVINLYKPRGVSSAKWVYRLRPLMHERRVGHAGSLDPFAEGVLVACMGKATRLVEQLMGLPKTYQVELELGVTSDSFDPERPVWPMDNARPPERAAVEAALARWTGDVEQLPPVFSAVKIKGRSAYELARRGRSPLIKPRTVRIDRITLSEYDWPRMTLRVDCGRGAYIRALARDLGAEWGCGAICRTLVRTRVGPFRIADAVDIDKLPWPRIQAAIRSIPDTLAAAGGHWPEDLPPVSCSDTQEAHGVAG